ncbi:MAG: selenide, water dikinase SelD, partial [Chloroflexi bacterium]
GHGMEMAEASGVALKFNFANVPFVSGARKYAEQGIFPGGAFDNKKYFEPNVEFPASMDEPNQMLLFDPQTSGGLLLGVPQAKLDAFLTRSKDLNQPAWIIGEVKPGAGIEIIG